MVAACFLATRDCKDLGRRHSETPHGAHGILRVPRPAVRNGPPAHETSITDGPKTLSPEAELRSVGSTRLMKRAFLPPLSVEQGAAMSTITEALSNAVQSVDRVLSEKRYREVRQFDRVMWLESVDKAQSTVWRVTPVRTGPDGESMVVGAISAIVYRDTELTDEDAARSFQISLCPQTGDLRAFWWMDRHGVLLVESSRGLSLGRDLGGAKSSVLAWDSGGSLLSSNTYDWSVRGRVIKGWTVSNTPVYDDAPVRMNRVPSGGARDGQGGRP